MAGGYPVQLALSDKDFAEALRSSLTRMGDWEVASVDQPAIEGHGVIVTDSRWLGDPRTRLAGPDRFVLVLHNDPEQIDRAWQAGVRSVVFDSDPVSTVVLAIMAASLRLQHPGSAVRGGGP
jgi:hypothetical protein